jgi:DNA repair exonuclease SbcCD ATPase subunit
MMDFELGDTPFSEHRETDDGLDLRQFYWINNVELDDDDIVVVSEIEDSVDDLIEKLKEDGDYSDSGELSPKKLKRSVTVRLKDQVAKELEPYFYSNTGTTNDPIHQLFEYTANEYKGRYGKATTESDDVEFTFRGCNSIESKAEKIKRVGEKRQFRSFDELYEDAKERLIERVKNLVEKDNDKLREYCVRNYSNIKRSEIEDEFYGDFADQKKEQIEEKKEQIEEIDREIEERIKDLKEQKKELKEEIEEDRDEILQHEVNELKDETDFPEDVVNEIEENVATKTTVTPPVRG